MSSEVSFGQDAAPSQASQLPSASRHEQEGKEPLRATEKELRDLETSKVGDEVILFGRKHQVIG